MPDNGEDGKDFDLDLDFDNEPNLEDFLVELGWRKKAVPANDIAGRRYLAGAWLADLDSVEDRELRVALFFYGCFYCYGLARPISPDSPDVLFDYHLTYDLVDDQIRWEPGAAGVGEDPTIEADDEDEAIEGPICTPWSYANGKLTIVWRSAPMTLSPTTFDDLVAAGFDRFSLEFTYGVLNTAINDLFEERVSHLPLVVPTGRKGAPGT